jgi:hypothetical protein
MRYFAPIVLVVCSVALAVEALDAWRSSALAPPRPRIDAIEPPLPSRTIEARQAPAAAIVAKPVEPADARYPRLRHGDGW